MGKGLTFDSGGYNLKVGPGSMIELMKFDMGGCAAVLGCAKAIAQLRPKVRRTHSRFHLSCRKSLSTFDGFRGVSEHLLSCHSSLTDVQSLQLLHYCPER